MSRFYKVTTLVGSSHFDRMKWEVGKTFTIENGPLHSRNDVVLWAEDTPGEAIEGESWPCRLFAIEGESFASDGHTFGSWELSVVGELPASQALGPNGEQVVTHIARCQALGPEMAAWLQHEISLIRRVDKGDVLFEAWHQALTVASGCGRRSACLAAREVLQDPRYQRRMPSPPHV